MFSMKKKLFIFSDVHGEYAALRETLVESGFDENNPNHLLISCGDIFDRGDESLSIYQYLKELYDKGKCICLTGNHEVMITDYLTLKDKSPWNYILNGVRNTFADFLHQTAPFEVWRLLDKHTEEPTQADFEEWVEKVAVKEINKEYPELLSWIQSMPYYFETKNYIFTHAAIDTTASDWHKPNIPWSELVWDDCSFFGKDIKNTNKVVVIGHVGTNHLRKMHQIGLNDPKWSILRREDGKVIALDATSNYSHKVNVLVIEDELLEKGNDTTN